jgi:hypothetical protein
MTSTNFSIKTNLRLIFAPENWNHIFKSNYEFLKILHPTSSSWPSRLRKLTFLRDVTRRIIFWKAFYYKYVLSVHALIVYTFFFITSMKKTNLKL